MHITRYANYDESFVYHNIAMLTNIKILVVRKRMTVILLTACAALLLELDSISDYHLAKNDLFAGNRLL
jgi:hypothetical protein